MKRHICTRCGKKRWACTNGNGMQFNRSICKRCFDKEHGPDPRKPRLKRVKRKKQESKPSGKKGRKEKDGLSRQK